MASEQETNSAQVRRLIEEVWNQGRLEVADEVFAPDFKNLNPGPDEAPGTEGLKGHVRMDRQAFADYHVEIDGMVAEGDLVAVRQSWSGRHVGERRGFAPTGKVIRGTAVNFFRFADGRIVERWGLVDALGVMRQLSS